MNQHFICIVRKSKQNTLCCWQTQSIVSCAGDLENEEKDEKMDKVIGKHRLQGLRGFCTSYACSEDFENTCFDPNLSVQVQLKRGFEEHFLFH